MANLKAIRKRIASVKSTQKITRAMKMVAGARLARAQARILALRPYAVKTQEVLAHVVETMRVDETGEAIEKEPDHPFLVERPEKTVVLLVLTSDRGLCGAFNTNINKMAERAWRERTEQGQTVQIYTLGRKGRDYLRRRKAPIVHDFARIWDGLDISKARLVSRSVVPALVKGEVDSIYLIYNEFKSAIQQRVVVDKLLPLPRIEIDPNLGQDEYLYEPDPATLFSRMLPRAVQFAVFAALLESNAAENGARMAAMDAATSNARDMIDDLTVQMNRIRQAAITKEIIEVVSGAQALS